MSHKILPPQPKKTKDVSGNVARAEFQARLDATMAEIHNYINPPTPAKVEQAKPITPAEVERAKQGFKKGMASLEKAIQDLGGSVEKGKPQPKPAVEKAPPLAHQGANIGNLAFKSDPGFDLMLFGKRDESKANLFNGKGTKQ